MSGRWTLIRLATVTPANVVDACRLELRPGQERFVAPVSWSLAEAYAQPEVAWPRLVYDDDRLVAFVMGGFDPDNELWFFRCGIWRLNVAGAHQGSGYGRFAVEAVLEEARSRGEQQASVLWVSGDGGPESFYLRLGFRPTGETFHDQVVGIRTLEWD